MADKFVWSGATGANDGSSWADAYTTLMKDWGAEAGFTLATDFVYVRSVHDESNNATITLTGSTGESSEAAVRILSVVGDTTGTTPGNLSAGAAVRTITTTTNDIAINERVYIYGVNFFSIDDITIGTSATDHDVTLENCRLELTGTSTTDRITVGSGNTVGVLVYLDDVTMDYGNQSQNISLAGGTLIWRGGTLESNQFAPIDAPGSASPKSFRAVGVDLSATASAFLVRAASGVNVSGLFVYERCLLGSGMGLINGAIDVPGFRIETFHCQAGTDADPAFQMSVEDIRGRVSTDTSRYRTGGASDGERTNPISWDFNTTGATVRGYPGHALESPPITGWTDGDASTSHTYRIYFASDASINNDEFWAVFELPNDAATNSKRVTQTTRVAPGTSASAHTTDGTSTWNGTGVTTKQYMEVTHTPDKPGPVTARIFMAKASDNIYVDPKIYIDP